MGMKPRTHLGHDNAPYKTPPPMTAPQVTATQTLAWSVKWKHISAKALSDSFMC